MQITRSFLRDAGLGALPDAAMPGYVANLQQRLWRSVSQRLATSLTPAQQRELAALTTRGNAARLEDWLARNVPGARALIDGELDALKARVRLDADAILALESLATPASAPPGHEYRSATRPRRFSL